MWAFLTDKVSSCLLWVWFWFGWGVWCDLCGFLLLFFFNKSTFCSLVCHRMEKSLGLFSPGNMLLNSEVSLVSRRMFCRGGFACLPISAVLQSLAAALAPWLPSLALCISQSFSKEVCPKPPRAQGISHSLCVFHMIQGVATKTKKKVQQLSSLMLKSYFRSWL